MSDTENNETKKNKSFGIIAIIVILLALLFGIWYFMNNRNQVNTYDADTRAAVPDIDASAKTDVTWQGETPQKVGMPSIDEAQDQTAPERLDMSNEIDTDDSSVQVNVPDIDPASKNDPRWEQESSQQAQMPSANNADDQTPPQNIARGSQKESLLFYFDSTNLKRGQRTKLKNFLNSIPANYKGGILVEGYTCDIGDEEYNKALSLERANTVANMLKQKGYRNVEVISYGESTYSEEQYPSRYLHRKVDISLK